MSNIPIAISGPIIFGYIITMVLVGVYFMKYMKNSSDFLLGGRKMGPWLIGASVFATNISGATLLGFTSTGYMLGISSYWVVVGPMMGGIFFAAFMAVRLRRMEVYTLAEVIDKFVDSKRSRLVATVISASRDFMYLGAQFVAFGTIFKFLFNFPFIVGSVLGAVITLIFSVAGGLMAVMWTDYIQLIVIMVATALIVPIAATKIGDWDSFMTSLPEEMMNVGSVTVTQVIGWFLMGIFAYTVSQHMYQRVFSARNSRVGQHGLVIGNSLGALWYVLPFFIGMLARSMYGDIIEETKAEPFLVLATNIAGPVFGAILLSALISALISTASTSVNLVSSNITMDIYQRFINSEASPEKLLSVGRWATFFVTIIGLVAALIFPQVLEMIFLGNKLAATIAPAMLLLIFWPKARYFEKPIFWSMLLGSISLLAFHQYNVSKVNSESTFIWAVDPIYVGIGVSVFVLVVGILISFMKLQEVE